MRTSKFSPQQIAEILKECDHGKSVIDITRDHGVIPTKSKENNINRKSLTRLTSLSFKL